MMIQRIRTPSFLALGFGLSLVTIVAGVGACADDDDDDDEYEPSVEIEINPDVDFSTYRTFDIVDPTLTADGTPPTKFVEIQRELEDAIVTQLGAKGLTRTTDEPDLLVNPFVSIDAVVDEVQFYEAYYGAYWGYEYLWTAVIDYDVGSLLIDVVDEGEVDEVADDVLVYRGVAKGLLSEDIDVIKLQIRNATQAIFADWPTDD